MNHKKEHGYEDISAQTKGTQLKKPYVKPVFQKHETLRVAANATGRDYSGRSPGISDF